MKCAAGLPRAVFFVSSHHSQLLPAGTGTLATVHMRSQALIPCCKIILAGNVDSAGFEKQSRKSNMARGGKREGAGRKPGVVSEAKRELSDMAKDHADNALFVLAQIMANEAEPAAARVSAANAILDRGYGKPPQAITGPGPNGEHVITQITRQIVDPKADGKS